MTTDSWRARYEALLEVANSVASYQSLPALIGVLADQFAMLMPSAGLGLVLYDEKRKLAKLYALESSAVTGVPAGQEFPIEETPTSVALETRRPFYVPDVASETRFPVIMRLLVDHGVASYCVLPLFTERRDIGSLVFGSTEMEAYSAEEIDFLCQAARQVAVAVENALNYEAAARSKEQLSAERDRLQLLLNVNNAVVAHLTTDTLFRAISGSLRETLNVELASLTLWDAESGQLRRLGLDVDGERNNQAAQRTDELIPIEGTVPGEAFQTRQPRVLKGRDPELATWAFARDLVEQGYCLVCSVPLISRDRVLGTLNVGSRSEELSPAEIDLLTQVGGQIAIAMDNAAAYGRIEELNARLAEEKLYLKDEIRSNYFFEEIIGRSPAMTAVLQQVEMVAPLDCTVLICGETGTGKELVARAIHKLSPRVQNAFVKVNCSAIPTGLLESELFGHERGAFTGAIAQRIGRFELAHHGTIFLDEIGDIALELQPKLLRVLQEREFERLGSSRTFQVDARLLAATNADLLRMVEEKKFRADLYYRLNVFPIVVPPLRERREDIPLLVSYFAQRFGARIGRNITSIPSETMDALKRYPWPGNIRELQNLVERGVILSSGSSLRVPLDVLCGESAAQHTPGTLAEVEREHILHVLQETDWVLSGPDGAATRLGLKRPTLQFRMKKLGIARPRQ